ncbi:MAG TPA: hypothetical protein VJN22_03080 [Candidatus Eremiobacteraceae bacterium]|nr:hypothetical protein [Candidatus Eremiobacteraceae bacterium]
MTSFTVTCLLIAAAAVISFAGVCVRPALRARRLALRLQTHPALAGARTAGDLTQSIAASAARFDIANRRFSVAAVSIDSALTSLGGYAGQVAAISTAVDGLLECLVPRLRGMLE